MADKYQTREERRKLQQGKPANKKDKRKKRSIFKRLFLAFFLICLIGLLSGVATFAYYASNAPKLNKKMLTDPVASTIYDKYNKPVETIGSVNRNYVRYDDLPKLVEDAVLATEDDRFYKHHGIDPIRLGGAIWANVTRGFGSEGASTITQQVVKMSFLTDQKTLKRKAQEAWLSLQLERQYTKHEILEMYLNKIYMGNGVHGIATAAKYYYNKSLDELKLPQVAELAGIQQSPNNYNPFDNPELAEKRRNIVLSLMYQHHKITKQEMEEAKKVPITYGLVKKEKRTKAKQKYDAFVDAVIDEVNSMGDYNVFTDGLKIYTTLDPKAQEYTEKMLNTNQVINYPDDKFQAGVTLLDTKTGEVRAIGGSRNPKVLRGINYAIDTKRSSGSTIKPILDYGPAIEYLKWSTYHQLMDTPTNYQHGNIPLHDWDGRYEGQMSMRTALYKSRNIPAYKTFMEVGFDNAKKFSSNLGFNFQNLVESSSIGEDVTSMQMAGAYAAFGNNGIYNKPHTVRKIVLRDGDTVVKNEIKPKIAMSDYTAYMITDMLKDVLTAPSGTGRDAYVPGLNLAGKTGTTNYTDDEMRKWNIPTSSAVPDAWFAGYNTDYTCAIWTGYPERKNYIAPGPDQHIAQLMFKHLISYVEQGKNPEDFKMPNSVVKLPVEIGTNPAQKPSASTPKDKITYELFVRGHDEPSQISQTYSKLESPTNVKGNYNKDTNEINLSWNHPKANVTFEITSSLNKGSKKSLGATSDKTLTIADVKPGTYTFEITAVQDGVRSKPAVISITVPDPNKTGNEQDNGDTGDGNTNNNNNDNGNNNNNNNNNGNGNKDTGNNGNTDNTGNTDTGNNGNTDNTGNNGNGNNNGNDNSSGNGNVNDNSGGDNQTQPPTSPGDNNNG